MEETKKDLVVQPSSEREVTIFWAKEQFELDQRKAKVYACSTLVPKQYQNNIGNCIVALNMAKRMNCDELMIMQNLVIVHNVPTFEAKFAIACFNATGRYTAIKYKEVGERGKDSYGMIAYAIEKSTGDVCEGPAITIAMAKAEGWYAQNPKWKNIPDLMLRYRAASWFIRTTDPGVMMGFQTKEEVEDYTDYEEVADEQPLDIPMETNSETLNMEPQEAEAPEPKEEEKPQQEQPATDVKPMGKQKTPDIFG